MTVDGALRVGDVAVSVDVPAEAPLVEATASNFSTGVQSEILDYVPILGRDIQNMVQVLPGVTQSTGPTGSGFDSQFGGFPDPTHVVGSGISVNGSQGGANAWYLDGSLSATLGPESVVVNPSPDAVSEFNLVDNGLAAEWSRTSGAVVNIVLKSGTNTFHGNVYEYDRNSFFSANNPFDRRSPTGAEFLSLRVNYNDFGGTLGGPILKNRTFFFFSWETSLLHETKNQIYTVPTPQEPEISVLFLRSAAVRRATSTILTPQSDRMPTDCSTAPPYSLYVERELPANMALTVGYVGTHGLHLYGDEFRNSDHVPRRFASSYVRK